MGTSNPAGAAPDLLVLQTVNTRWSKEKAARRLSQQPVARLLLDFPPEVEAYFRRVRLGRPWEETLSELERRGLLRAPEESQEYRALEPVMSRLKSLTEDVACAGDSRFRAMGSELSGRLATLTLRGRMGSVDPGEWRHALMDDVLISRDAARRQAQTVALLTEKTGDPRASTASIDLPAETVEELRRMGLEVERVVLDRPALPLDRLRALLRREVETGEPVDDETTARLVREHLEFVGRVTVAGYDEAYREQVERAERPSDSKSR